MMQRVMHSAHMEHIIDLWPNMRRLADALAVPYPTVAAWRQRNRIPSEYDFALIGAAKDIGVVLTLEQLAQARQAVPRKKSSHNSSPSETLDAGAA